MNVPQATQNVQSIPGLPFRADPARQAFASVQARVSATPDRFTPESGNPRWAALAVGVLDPATMPVVQVRGLWLPQQAARQLRQSSWSWSRSPQEIARAAVQRGLGRMAELAPGMLTQHALLLAWAEFADEIGLLDQLRQVSIPQKEVIHAPQGKVLSFFLGILSGITHLKDLNEGPHPLAHDWPAIRAWGLPALAHYSGISRTLAACAEQTVQAISAVLQQVSQPFIDQEVCLLRQQGGPVIVDLDLAPRRVSNTATSFPGAEFGWQDDRVGQGYDAALAALTSPSYDRLFLCGFHHPRKTMPLPRLQKMVRAVEARLGKRPRRRPELVQQRRAALREKIEQRLAWLSAQLDRRQAIQARLETLPLQVTQWEEEVARLEATAPAQDRAPRPHSRLNQARRRLQAVRRKLHRAPQQLAQAERAIATHQRHLARFQAEYRQLQAHLEQLQADNEGNTDPLRIILRLDAGFGTGPNLTWLIEMGYQIYTKAFSAQVAAGLLQQVPPATKWTRVGKNAAMVGWGEHSISKCPYPLTVAVERFHTPKGLKHSTLIAYRDDDQSLTLAAWFEFYNARQIIEAGIKESNVVFKMHPLKLRSPGGIALQEQFVLFAANFVRWAAAWLRQRVSQSSRRFEAALERVKAMVRVGANTSAVVVAEDESLLLRFDETGAYPGVELRLAGTWRTRPPILPREKVPKFDFKNDFASGCT